MQKPFYRLEFSRDGTNWSFSPKRKIHWDVGPAVHDAMNFIKEHPNSSLKVRMVNGRTRHVLFPTSVIKPRFGAKA
jgi:hypothetical protein